jgi:tripartite-type tricarboxylate transporter receptor subunit TctC
MTFNKTFQKTYFQLKTLALAFGMAAPLLPAWAQQDFPSRAVKIVVPYGAGTGVDVAARLMAVPLAKQLGQPVVIDNKPGAAGGLGTAFVANSSPDGYTILAHASSLTSVPAFQKVTPYAVSDLVGVSIYADLPFVLVASPSSGLKSVKDLVAAAKARPGSLSFASAGVGTGTYIGVEKLHLAENLKVLHVPYKSTTDALTDVMSGRVDYLYTQITSAVGQVNAGKLVPLAVSSKRSSTMPNVPTIAEAGVPSAYYSLWVGLLAPAKTPRSAIKRLYEAIEKVRNTPEFKQQLAQIGGEVVANTPEEFDAILKKESAENEQMVKRLGIEKQ